jgi:hypothetical protein
LLLADKRPDFIALDMVQRQVAELLIKKVAAGVSELKYNPRNGFLLAASDTGCRADRIAFAEQA